MSKREYSIREKEIISKINKVNNVLRDRKIKINYSVYNYNGIASKLEKSDLYGSDVSDAVFIRIHTCDAKYMVDSVVNSYNLKNNVDIEECFNTKISDIENADIDDLVDFFGNMNNHEIRGFGKNREYQIAYKGIDKENQEIEIKAWYGAKDKYKIRQSVTKVGIDGVIKKEYLDKTINFDEKDLNAFEKQFAQGVEEKSPESYSLVENYVDGKGNKKFQIECVGMGNINYQITSGDNDFKNLNSVNYAGKAGNYYEYYGRIEKSSGKLSCRIDMNTGSVVKPNFSSVKNIVDANKVCNDYYNKYKNSPIVKIDDKANKIIIQGRNSELYKLNLDQVEKSVKENFEYYLNKGWVIETVNKNPEKKFIKGLKK